MQFFSSLGFGFGEFEVAQEIKSLDILNERDGPTLVHAIQGLRGARISVPRRTEPTNGIASAGEDTICTSIVVAVELRFGAEKSGSAKLMGRVDLILSAVEILPLEPADRHYGQIRQLWAHQGTLIGPNDLLIAAHALALGFTVVTANTREFSRVPGLSVENWLA